MSTNEPSADAEKRLEEIAQPAEGDTEVMLRELDVIQAQRRKDPGLERRYERLRNALAARLEKEGPRYYLDLQGNKRYAYAVVPEPIEVDVDKLCELDESGELKAGVLERVAPRKVIKDEYRAAVARGDITRKQFLATSTLGRGTPYVGFADDDDDST